MPSPVRRPWAGWIEAARPGACAGQRRQAPHSGRVGPPAGGSAAVAGAAGGAAPWAAWQAPALFVGVRGGEASQQPRCGQRAAAQPAGGAGAAGDPGSGSTRLPANVLQWTAICGPCRLLGHSSIRTTSLHCPGFQHLAQVYYRPTLGGTGCHRTESSSPPPETKEH